MCIGAGVVLFVRTLHSQAGTCHISIPHFGKVKEKKSGWMSLDVFCHSCEQVDQKVVY